MTLDFVTHFSLFQLIVFPTPAQQSFQLTPFAQYFQARQVVSEPASQFSLTATSFQTCEENIAFKLYCDPAVTANRCIFIHTYVEGTRACAGEVQLCAQATTQVPTARRSRLGVQQGANNAN